VNEKGLVWNVPEASRERLRAFCVQHGIPIYVPIVMSAAATLRQSLDVSLEMALEPKLGVFVRAHRGVVLLPARATGRAKDVSRDWTPEGPALANVGLTDGASAVVLRAFFGAFCGFLARTVPGPAVLELITTSVGVVDFSRLVQS